MNVNSHQPKKIFENEQVIIFDDFLPPEVAEIVYDNFIASDFEYINTNKIDRAWKIGDQFPLRGRTVFYNAKQSQNPKPDWVYPSNTPLDAFIDAINNIIPNVSHLVGKPGQEWQRFAVAEWLYQQGTGLSLHSDGEKTYSGAYTYFLNKEWNLHWGGLLLVVDKMTDKVIEEFKKQYGPVRYWKQKWLVSDIEALLTSEPGMGQFVFPKFNRIVFIKNTAHHMVTTVLPSAGDRTRKSLAGFFHINAS